MDGEKRRKIIIIIIRLCALLALHNKHTTSSRGGLQRQTPCLPLTVTGIVSISPTSLPTYCWLLLLYRIASILILAMFVVALYQLGVSQCKDFCPAWDIFPIEFWPFFYHQIYMAIINKTHDSRFGCEFDSRNTPTPCFYFCFFYNSRIAFHVSSCFLLCCSSCFIKKKTIRAGATYIISFCFTARLEAFKTHSL